MFLANEASYCGVSISHVLLSGVEIRVTFKAIDVNKHKPTGIGFGNGTARHDMTA